MHTVEEMITQYVNAWNEDELNKFKTAFAKCLSSDMTYTDPQNELINGLNGLSELAEASLKNAPGRKFKVVNAPIFHHRTASYVWQMQLPAKSLEGLDYIEYNENFKITKLVSFFPFKM